MTNLQWVNETNLFALDALEEYLDLDLPSVELPKPESTAAAVPFEHLVQSLKRVETPDTYVQHQLRILFRLSRHLQRWDQAGRAIVEANLDDIGALTGKRPGSWAAGEEALEKFVTQDDGSHDMALIQLFNRKLSRAISLNGPPGSAMARHNAIQRFDGTTGRKR
jgi:hypothetical protein